VAGHKDGDRRKRLISLTGSFSQAFYRQEDTDFITHFNPERVMKMLAVIEAAQVIRYEWNVGMSEPTEDSLKELFKVLRELEEE
jgi:hypothetical protein